MKRLLLSVSSLLLAAATVSAGTGSWINTGVIQTVTPPDASPAIDASNFVNYGYISIDNYDLFGAVGTNFGLSVGVPFTTQNTYNFYNYNQIRGNPGFVFSLFDSSTSLSRMAANFVNAASVNETNASIYGETHLHIAATNIVNRGTLASSALGVIGLQGENIDLDRGFVAMLGGTNAEAGIIDNFWGVDTNTLAATWNPSFIYSSPMMAERIDGLMYTPFFMQVRLTNGYTAYITVSPQSSVSDQNVDILFLGNTNPDIATEVRFANFLNGAEKVVKWTSVATNHLNGVLVTNELYLDDTFPFYLVPGLMPTGIQSPTVNQHVTTTFRPFNYAITRTFPGFENFTQIAPSQFNPLIFVGTNNPPIVTNAGYGAIITAEAFRPDPYLAGATYSNMAGRVEIIANKVLDLNRARIDGESFLRLKTTNHFAGSLNAQIIAPFSSVDLASTNSTLAISGLMSPTIPRMKGTIECWSGRWTNANVNGSSLYNVTVVDSRLVNEGTPIIEDLHLRATNLVISDIMNVEKRLLLEGQSLTITTNPPGAPTVTGELNLMRNDLLWSPSLPQLQYLTNFGRITTPNAAYFAGARTPPWFTGTFDEAYRSFVNHGIIASQGNETWATYYEFSGTNSSGVGPATIRAGTGIFTNGVIQATNADITISGGSITLSNVALNAGRAITLSATDLIDDGTLTTDPEIVTNKNTWNVHAGFNLTGAPLYGSLLGTTVTNTALAYANVVTTWGGKDGGTTNSAFATNTAIGRLILDGGQGSIFTFQGVGTTPTALYVDSLELKNYAAARDASGNVIGVRIQPNLKIYFAQAIAGGVSIAEKLDGRNNGQFVWVSSYAGFYSSTNLVYPDGSTNRVNAALAGSCTIDSNGNGIVNCLDPAPIPPSSITGGNGGAGGTGGNGGTGGTDGGGTTNTNGTSTNVLSGYPVLSFPSSGPAMANGIGFAGAAGTYSGLFYATNGVTAQSSGYFAATTTARQGYTATIRLGGRSYSFSGRFDNQGVAVKSISRAGLSPLTLSLQLDLVGGCQLVGRVTDGSWSADLVTDKRVFNALKNRHPLAGKYFTFRIPPDANAAGSPAGSGYGAIRVDGSGNLTWSGTLADGTKVSQTTVLSRQGYWPLYAAPYGGRGLLLGWVQAGAEGLGGDFIWIKPSGVTGNYYPAGFTNQVEAVGSPYTRVAGQRVVELFNGYGKLILTGAGLPANLVNTVHLDDFNRVTYPENPYALKLTLTPSTGLFTGQCLNPQTRKLILFKGVLLQNDNSGAGFFLTPDYQGGQVLLQSPGG